MTDIHRTKWQRLMAWLLCFCMILSLNNTIAYAIDGAEDTGLCVHHTAHTVDCGYSEAKEGAPCSHVHDEICGYREAKEETPCTHEHDDTCGWQEGTEGSCSHVHDGACGYQAAAEEISCAHEHNNACGYQAGTEGRACTYDCQVCNLEKTVQDKTDGSDIGGNDIGGNDVIGNDTASSSGAGNSAVTNNNIAAAARAQGQEYTAYDNGTPDGKIDPDDPKSEAASVKFTVTLPEGTKFYSSEGEQADTSEGLTLRIQEYTNGTQGFDFIAHRDLINQHMNWHTGVSDSTNDAQFWRVWFEDESGGEVDVKLPAKGRAVVVVEYLNAEKALKGKLGTRRTCVMNMDHPDISVPADVFINTDDYSLAASYEPEDIGKEEDHYTKITYYVDGDENGNSAWGNLTALCSMKLTGAYMQNASIYSIADGSAPWDAEVENGVDEPGNDSSDSNRIVRSFDSVVYTLNLVSAARRATNGDMDQYIAVVEAELDLDITQARFDSASLTSVFVGDEDWRIEYKDNDGKNLYIENKSGLFKCDSSGAITSEKVSLNGIVNGSDNTNQKAYRTNVVSQRLVAYRTITGTTGNPAVPSTQTVTVQVNVSAAQNGDKITPEFTAYVKGNKDNFTSEQNAQNEYVVSKPSEDNQIKTQDTPNAVTVSAAARYNLVIKRNFDASYNSYFNFTTGQETTSSDQNGVYGRMLSYGITLQLFNETNKKGSDGNPDGATLAEKGMRGVELPVNGISFKVSIEGTPGKNSGSTDDYSAILWDYAKSIENTKTGRWGRNLYWKNSTATTFPKGAAVFSNGDRSSSAYDSGEWSLSVSGEGVDDGKTTGEITNTGVGVQYDFTVEGYDFDFENFTFPTKAAGNAGDMDWLAPSYIGSFSAGHIQILQKYPVEPTSDATPEVTVTLSEFRATSQSSETEKNIDTEAEAVTDEIGGELDNKCNDSIPIYTPGSISKHNSFGDRDSGHGSLGEGFLGTSYWEGPNYDADTFAGSSIYLWGGTQLSRNSDAVASAYNLLQKFDSKALSIDTTVDLPVRYTEVNNDGLWPAVGWPNDKEGELEEEAGDYKILYAADPLYPDGWDSNVKEQMERMNAAKEDDLIYFKSIEELEAAGYTCIAVLLEVRNAEIPAGCYPGVRIAMKVSDDTDGIGKTVCTVNTSRMWIKGADKKYDLLSDITWENGNQNGLTREAAQKLTAQERDSFQNTIVDQETKEDVYSDYWDEARKDQVNKALQEQYDDSTATYLVSGYNNTPYTKTEYKNGIKVEDTHEGYQQGMSLLVIGYESTVGIKVENTRTGHNSDTIESGNVSFETGKGDWNPLYTIKGIKTTPNDPTGSGATDQKTNLIIKASVQNEAGKSQIAMGASEFKVQSLVDELDEDGNPTGGKILDWISVSEEENKPTTVTFQDSSGRESTYKIWASRIGEYEADFYLSEVPVGESLPDIQFTGQLGVDIEHTKNYTAEVSIQGDSDNRALSSGNQNIATVSVTTVVLANTSLTKTVDENLIEQNGSFTYSINYSNNSDDAMAQKLYLYDLMPYNGDVRSTDYELPEPGEGANQADRSDTLKVLNVSGNLTGDSANSKDTIVRQYYSTIVPEVLKPYIEFAEGSDNSGKDIDDLLRYALMGNDANGLYYVVKKGDESHTPVSIYVYDENNIVTGLHADFDKKEFYDTADVYGEVHLPEGYAFYNITSGEVIDDDLQVTDNTSTGNKGTITLQCYKMFRWLGSIQPGVEGSDKLESGNGEASSHLANATCLYSVVEKLGAKTTLTISASLETNGNEAANIYGNIAHSWKAGDERDGANLISNMVTTRVVGREISGLVWEDADCDGVQDENEKRIAGVTCTLFQWNESEGKYEPCSEGPNGRPVVGESVEGTSISRAANDGASVVTGEDGTYSFKNLKSGDYVVAFEVPEQSKAGEEPCRYRQTSYQANGGNDSDTNDGVVNAADKYPGIDAAYSYCIQYASDKVNVYMHSLDELKADTTLLVNSIEAVEHQDLGLIFDHYELPETGGSGTLPYRMAGVLLLAACLPGTIFLYKKRRYFLEQNN